MLYEFYGFGVLGLLLMVGILVAGICFVIWFVNKENRANRDREEILYRRKNRDNRNRGMGGYNMKRHQDNYKRDDRSRPNEYDDE